MDITNIKRILSTWQIHDTTIWSIDELFEKVERRTGHTIKVLGVELPYSPSGLLVQIDGYDIDLILVADDANFIHRHHICLHELAHLLCGHKAEIIDAHIVKELIGRNFPADLVRALARSSFETETQQEQDAESIATFLTKQFLDYLPIKESRILKLSDIDQESLDKFGNHLNELDIT